ncbi:MAG: ectonucleotide pyrophosphatase/phosphodiesterase [Clostridiaceae bacterium]
MHEHIVVISLDAMGTADFNQLKDTPGFQYLLENGTYCDQVTSVCPSLTYPAHCSIVTGKMPRNHGIINNTKIQPDRDQPEWFWYRKDIHGETIWDIAHKQKKSVASLLWPVTGRSNIKYNLPEIIPVRAYQTQVSQVMAAGSPRYCLELDNKFKHLRKGIAQPWLDHFVHASAKYTFSKYQPYLTLVHYVDLDSMRHEHGLDSEEARQAILRHGERINDWINFLRESGKLETTVFIVLGDHYHRAVKKVIRPNVFLRKLGLIKMIENDILDWKAYFKSCDGSGYIYVDKRHPEVVELIRDNLTVLSAYEENGLLRFMDGSTASSRGADPNCTFMLCACDGYYFSESPIGEFIEDVENDPALYRSCHGYEPHLPDYHTVFLMSGPGIRCGHRIAAMNLIDEGPTIAKLMGSSLWGVDGRIRYDFFSDILP